jgi:hypothetical protein
MWTALSAERKTPFAKVNLDFVFGDVLVGREVLPNLYVQGGFRRLALDIHATVESSSALRSPGFWDPLVGLTYRRQLGRKWRILIHGDGGGFGAGADVDMTATGRAEWQFARHFGITMGYGGMHFSESDTVAHSTSHRQAYLAWTDLWIWHFLLAPEDRVSVNWFLQHISSCAARLAFSD